KATGHAQQHTQTSADTTAPAHQHERTLDTAKHHAKHGQGRHAKAKSHPLHASPYARLTVHWTIPDPLGLEDCPKIAVPEFPVPPFLLPIYQAAGAQYRIHWQIL